MEERGGRQRENEAVNRGDKGDTKRNERKSRGCVKVKDRGKLRKIRREEGVKGEREEELRE